VRTWTRPNYQLIKIHRNYDPGEIADLLRVHKNTVLRWIKTGLPLVETRRPFLILGEDLRAYLKQIRVGKKQKCQLWEMYCFKCRAPKKPAFGEVDFKPRVEPMGNLVGLCPDCSTVMNRSINRAALDRLKGDLKVSFPVVQEHIVGSNSPSLNSDLKTKG
jgi:excisionase family DNA binding protein